MNWQAIGATGEILGALGVVVTLAYLTMQVRQNTKSINSNNSNNVMTGFNQINVALLTDADAARICYDGFYGIHKLTEIEQHRFRHLMNGFFNIYRNLFHQYLDGTFSDSQWETWALEARQMMMTPGVAHFRERTKTYEDLFSYLEKMPDDSPRPLTLKGVNSGES
jgi:hypothetical protein